MRVAAIVPAFQAERDVGPVVEGLARHWPVLVVDDGSTDSTSEIAREAGAEVLRHGVNRGKGAALRTGMREALRLGMDAVISVDADGQHPPSEAVRLHQSCGDPAALVIGVRDLAGAQAPRANQLSNRFSNWAISGFAGRRLQDTQCGLRRYPLAATLGLHGCEDGYGYEAEILIRAAAVAMRIVHVPIRVIYPPPDVRTTHFHSVRDPAKIVTRVVRTVIAVRLTAVRNRLDGVMRAAK